MNDIFFHAYQEKYRPKYITRNYLLEIILDASRNSNVQLNLLTGWEISDYFVKKGASDWGGWVDYKNIFEQCYSDGKIVLNQYSEGLEGTYDLKLVLKKGSSKTEELTKLVIEAPSAEPAAEAEIPGIAVEQPEPAAPQAAAPQPEVSPQDLSSLLTDADRGVIAEYEKFDFDKFVKEHGDDFAKEFTYNLNGTETQFSNWNELITYNGYFAPQSYDKTPDTASQPYQRDIPFVLTHIVSQTGTSNYVRSSAMNIFPVFLQESQGSQGVSLLKNLYVENSNNADYQEKILENLGRLKPSLAEIKPILDDAIKVPDLRLAIIDCLSNMDKEFSFDQVRTYLDGFDYKNKNLDYYAPSFIARICTFDQANEYIQRANPINTIAILDAFNSGNKLSEQVVKNNIQPLIDQTGIDPNIKAAAIGFCLDSHVNVDLDKYFESIQDSYEGYRIFLGGYRKHRVNFTDIMVYANTWISNQLIRAKRNLYVDEGVLLNIANHDGFIKAYPETVREIIALTNPRYINDDRLKKWCPLIWAFKEAPVMR
ncbi:hypothetical protein HZA38_05145 [Candidatus Peregrinibacteria bacterium]|nr:hypothetical protein [Candidatus Peregrinibacteria bacterium]